MSKLQAPSLRSHSFDSQALRLFIVTFKLMKMLNWFQYGFAVCLTTLSSKRYWSSCLQLKNVNHQNDWCCMTGFSDEMQNLVHKVETETFIKWKTKKILRFINLTWRLLWPCVLLPILENVGETNGNVDWRWRGHWETLPGGGVD